jgi:predicted TIM-barrel fold metal-dependent hydrolase
MRIITLEEHMTTPEIAKLAPLVSSGPAAGIMQARTAKLLEVGAGRIADMDAAGIDVQVLSVATNATDGLDADRAYALSADANDRLAAAVRAHPTRFAAFANVAVQEPEKAAAELERCIHQLGFHGLMLNGAPNGQFFDHPRFTPILEAAHAMDVPVYLHPAPPPKPVMEAYYSGLPGAAGFFLSTSGWGWHVETGMHSLRLILAGVFDRFPKLKIIIGHMGENLPFSLARVRTVGEYFREHFYLTTSGYFTVPPFVCMQQVVGIDRILFSVDYPFSSNVTGRKFLDELDLSAQDLDKFTHVNAERLLKL